LPETNNRETDLDMRRGCRVVVCKGVGGKVGLAVVYGRIAVGCALVGDALVGDALVGGVSKPTCLGDTLDDPSRCNTIPFYLT